MPRRIKEWGDQDLKTISEGVHFVGGIGGLTLQVKAPKGIYGHRSASWVLRVYFGSKRRNIGLGSFPEVSLATARDKASEVKALCQRGIDPIRLKHEHRRRADADRAASIPFKRLVEQYLTTHQINHRNAKHAKQWRASLENYALPELGLIPVRDISPENILSVLQPIWASKTETAKRLQGRLERVLDLAIASGLRDTNPARWRNFLSVRLPSPSRIARVTHFASLPYQDLGRFMQALKTRSGIAPRALEFLILTAVRSGSVRQARWQEIDFERLEWRVPKDHTKTRTDDHRVPLTPQMIKLLETLPRRDNTDLIFPSPNGKVLSDMALNMLMRKMRASGELWIDAVPHGFRSTFRVWAAEATNYSPELAELCLMHSVGSSVYQAYQRSDLFEKRRQIMADWSDAVFQGRETS
jgi:integrase